MKRLIQIMGLALALLALVVLTSGCDSHSEEGDQAVFGGSRTIHEGETIDGNLAIFGGDVLLEQGATVDGDIAIFGGRIVIDGTVNGDIATFGGEVERGEDAEIKGETLAFGGSDKGRPTVIPVKPVEPVPPVMPEQPKPVIPPVPPQFEEGFGPSPIDHLFALIGGIVATIIKTIAFGALGLALTIFMPDHVRRVGKAAETAPAATMAVGCMGLVAIPFLIIVSVVAAFTIIGLPITFLVALLLPASLIFGWIGLGFVVGNRLLQASDIRSPRPAAATAIGAASLFLATSLVGWLIPPLAAVAIPLLCAWGLGATILTVGGKQPYPMRPALATAMPSRAFDPLDDIAPSPRTRPTGGKPSGNLFADLAADLGIEDEIYGDDDDTKPNRPERPVNPPDGK